MVNTLGIHLIRQIYLKDVIRSKFIIARAIRGHLALRHLLKGWKTEVCRFHSNWFQFARIARYLTPFDTPS
jgi:hypothetical protein